jgi:hypothetical protein
MHYEPYSSSMLVGHSPQCLGHEVLKTFNEPTASFTLVCILICGSTTNRRHFETILIQYPGIILGIIGQNPSVSESNGFLDDIVWFAFINLRHIL